MQQCKRGDLSGFLLVLPVKWSMAAGWALIMNVEALLGSTVSRALHKQDGPIVLVAASRSSESL